MVDFHRAVRRTGRLNHRERPRIKMCGIRFEEGFFRLPEWRFSRPLAGSEDGKFALSTSSFRAESRQESETENSTRGKLRLTLSQKHDCETHRGRTAFQLRKITERNEEREKTGAHKQTSDNESR